MKIFSLTTESFRFVFRAHSNRQGITDPIGNGYYCKLDGTPFKNGTPQPAVAERRRIKMKYDACSEHELTGPMKSVVSPLFADRAYMASGDEQPNTPLAGLADLLAAKKS